MKNKLTFFYHFDVSTTKISLTVFSINDNFNVYDKMLSKKWTGTSGIHILFANDEDYKILLFIYILCTHYAEASWAKKHVYSIQSRSCSRHLNEEGMEVFVWFSRKGVRVTSKLCPVLHACVCMVWNLLCFIENVIQYWVWASESTRWRVEHSCIDRDNYLIFNSWYPFASWIQLRWDILTQNSYTITGWLLSPENPDESRFLDTNFDSAGKTWFLETSPAIVLIKFRSFTKQDGKVLIFEKDGIERVRSRRGQGLKTNFWEITKNWLSW